MLSRSWTSWLALVVSATLGSAVLLGTVALGSARPDAIEAVVASAAPVDGEDLASEDGKSGTLRAALDKLVQAGVITAEQRDRILKAIEEEQAAAKRKRGQADKPKPPAIKVDLLREAAAAIGIELKQFLQELREEKTVAKVAAKHGLSRDAVVQRMTATANAKVDEAVASGRLDAARAAQMKERLAKQIAELVDRAHTFPAKDRPKDKPKPPGPPRDKPKPPAAAQPKFHVLQHLVQDAAEAIGVSPGQLKQELRGGKSLKDVAQAHGVSRDALIQKLVAAETARIRKALEAGRISKETAERLERRLAEAVVKAVDAVRGKR